jgi:pimeloyl-ACP methyl ester carboxylesterase
MAKHYRGLIPHVDVVELEGIGHYPQVQAPKAVLSAYFRFREHSD